MEVIDLSSYPLDMLIDRQREKLIEIVKFFAHNTRNLGKTKLYKLLYFLDFTHFRDTGRAVTGMDYFAWKMGPVPVDLHSELATPNKDWANSCQFEHIPVKGGEMLKITPLSSFDSTHFSKRELRLMKELAVEFRIANAEEMVERTHLENLPWHQVYEVENQKKAHIPYEMSLRKQDYHQMLELVKDREEILHILRK